MSVIFCSWNTKRELKLQRQTIVPSCEQVQTSEGQASLQLPLLSFPKDLLECLTLPSGDLDLAITSAFQAAGRGKRLVVRLVLGSLSESSPHRSNLHLQNRVTGQARPMDKDTGRSLPLLGRPMWLVRRHGGIS